jgi:hypothetical protein
LPSLPSLALPDALPLLDPPDLPDLPAPIALADADDVNALPMATADTPPAPAEDTVPAPAPSTPARALPSRIDLTFKAYLGSQGFLIGDATYRFEHADNRYRIHTVGQARGLVALFVHGEGRVESHGLITAKGLQPMELRFERSDTGKREEARIDWEAGVVKLDGNKTAAIDTPLFDALSLMWQYYFTPPDTQEIAFSLATTRRVARYRLTREDDETIRWGAGSIQTERWHRVDEEGQNHSYAWLAPSLRWLPVKMRIASKRGAVEIVLDAIRVDPSARAAGDDWVPDLKDGAQSVANAPAPASMSLSPTEFAPNAVFSNNTGG